LRSHSQDKEETAIGRELALVRSIGHKLHNL
jgi:hypothetical protein